MLHHFRIEIECSGLAHRDRPPIPVRIKGGAADRLARHQSAQDSRCLFAARVFDTALVAAGVLTFPDALRLVTERGRLAATKGARGAMAGAVSGAAPCRGP